MHQPSETEQCNRKKSLEGLQLCCCKCMKWSRRRAWSFRTKKGDFFILQPNYDGRIEKRKKNRFFSHRRLQRRVLTKKIPLSGTFGQNFIPPLWKAITHFWARCAYAEEEEEKDSSFFEHAIYFYLFEAIPAFPCSKKCVYENRDNFLQAFKTRGLQWNILHIRENEICAKGEKDFRFSEGLH